MTPAIIALIFGLVFGYLLGWQACAERMASVIKLMPKALRDAAKRGETLESVARETELEIAKHA